MLNALEPSSRSSATCQRRRSRRQRSRRDPADAYASAPSRRSKTKEQEVTPEIMRVVEQRYLLLADHRSPVGRSSLRDGSPEDRYRPARLRAKRSARRVRKRSLRDLRVAQEQHRRRSDQRRLPRGDRARPAAGSAASATAAVRADSGRRDGAAGGPQGRLSPQEAEHLLGPAPGAPRRPQQLHTNLGDGEPAKPARAEQKVGRNELCPCGSGKKYKKCHGAGAA